MAPTARATAAMNISKGASPRHRPTAKVNTARAPMAISSQLEKAAILRVRGVIRSGVSPINLEMRPVSVASPVAMAMPVP